MEVEIANFAINKMAAEASQAACCRSTMGPKMAAKLEADNDSGPHTTEADYEEQDVRKVFVRRVNGRLTTGSGAQIFRCRHGGTLEYQVESSVKCSQQDEIQDEDEEGENQQVEPTRRRKLTCATRTFSSNVSCTWQFGPTIVVLAVIMVATLLLFGRQINGVVGDQIAVNQEAIFSTGKW